MISRKLKKLNKKIEKKIGKVNNKLVNKKLEYYIDYLQKGTLMYCQIKNFNGDIISEFLLNIDIVEKINNLNIELEYKKELQNKIKLL